jgi:hypothetical protein
VVATATVVAQDDSGGSSGGNSSQDVETAEATKSSQDTEDKPKTDGAKERLEALKSKRAERITKAEEARLKAGCRASQGKISTAQTRFNKIRSNRKSTYKEIEDKLSRLSERLVAAGVDTAAFDAALADIRMKIQEFSEVASSYDQTLADLAAMDCTADPEAFKAALESAREDREALVAKAEELKTYIKTTVRAVIEELKAALSVTTASDDNGEGEGTN